MKTSQFIGAAILAVLGVSTVHAETYQGVLNFHSERSRTEVAAEARVVARAGNIYGDVAQAGVTAPRTSNLARAVVRDGAVDIARAGNVYGDVAQNGVAVADSQRDRASVRAEARVAARTAQSLY